MVRIRERECGRGGERRRRRKRRVHRIRRSSDPNVGLERSEEAGTRTTTPHVQA